MEIKIKINSKLLILKVEMKSNFKQSSIFDQKNIVSKTIQSRNDFINKQFNHFQDSIQYNEPKVQGLSNDLAADKKAEALTEYFNSFYDLEVERLKSINQLNSETIDGIRNKFVRHIDKMGLRSKLGLNSYKL